MSQSLLATDYITVDATHLGQYLPDLTGAQLTQWTPTLQTLAHAASRFIDSVTGQMFYREQTATKYIPLVDPMGSMQGNRQVMSKQPFFPAKIGYLNSAASAGATSVSYASTDGVVPVANDAFVLDDGLNAEIITVNSVVGGSSPYTLNLPAGQSLAYAHGAGVYSFLQISILLAYYENQPRANWLTLVGDGKNPPSNYFFWPSNVRSFSAAGTAYYKPWWGFDLAHIPSPNTQFLPLGMGGYATVAITAGWGWPAVPDVIADLCAKAVVRAWKSLQAGQRMEGGSPTIGGTINMAQHFDEKDLEILANSEWIALSL